MIGGANGARGITVRYAITPIEVAVAFAGVAAWARALPSGTRIQMQSGSEDGRMTLEFRASFEHVDQR